MAYIFHEKQEGSLCAVHCLNALLQGSYFTPVELGVIASDLDAEEKLLQQKNFPSANMDDSGYFSVQVIAKALQIWALDLVPLGSSEPRAVKAMKTPADMQAYICHYRDHWFTIRKVQNKWYNLNSLLPAPLAVSDTYLSLFLVQLKNEGYSIFLVVGDLPVPAVDLPPIKTEKEQKKQAWQLPIVTPVVSATDVDENTVKVELEDDLDPDLERAILLSLSCHETN